MIFRKSLIFLTSIFLLWETDLRPICHHLIDILVDTYAEIMRSRFFLIKLHQLVLRGRYSLSFSMRRMVYIPARIALFALSDIFCLPHWQN